MEGGNAAIAMYYAGDYLTMLENNEDLAFVIPEEGSNWFVDAMCVLKDTQHMAEAEEWINFIASTSSNLANMDYIWYASPQPGGAGAVPGLLPGGQRGGAGPGDLPDHGSPGRDPGPLRDL